MVPGFCDACNVLLHAYSFGTHQYPTLSRHEQVGQPCYLEARSHRCPTSPDLFWCGNVSQPCYLSSLSQQCPLLPISAGIIVKHRHCCWTQVLCILLDGELWDRSPTDFMRYCHESCKVVAPTENIKWSLQVDKAVEAGKHHLERGSKNHPYSDCGAF